MVKEKQKQIIREINNGSWRSKDDCLNIINQTNIYKIMKSTTIENGIKRALATGDFDLKIQISSTFDGYMLTGGQMGRPFHGTERPRP